MASSASPPEHNSTHFVFNHNLSKAMYQRPHIRDRTYKTKMVKNLAIQELTLMPNTIDHYQLTVQVN
jgi:hypothetical protein